MSQRNSTTSDVIEANALKILEDPNAAAAAKMAAANMLLKIDGRRGGQGIGALDRDDLIAEITHCAHQLGRKSLKRHG